MNERIVILVGGVGGAKLALGMSRVVDPENLTIIVNTGDDFWHYGLRITPDIDTVLYTLSGRVNPATGWGIEGDTFNVIEQLRRYGDDVWFTLGDEDIATHMLRTRMLNEGKTPTEVVARLAAEMGVRPTILPMTDSTVATRVYTAEYGELDFQAYFVKYQWQPTVTSLEYAGIDRAQLSAAVIDAIENANAIIVGPSNPWLSIAPILAVPGMRDLLRSRNVPRVAVTPIVEGRAIKGPAAKLMRELGYDVSADAVRAFYGDVINGFVADVRDQPAEEKSSGFRNRYFDTIMTTTHEKIQLAQQLLDWIKDGDFA